MIDYTINAEAIWRGHGDALLHFYRLYLEHFNSDAKKMNEVYHWTPEALSKALEQGRAVYEQRARQRPVKKYGFWHVTFRNDTWTIIRLHHSPKLRAMGREYLPDEKGDPVSFGSRGEAQKALDTLLQEGKLK